MLLDEGRDPRGDQVEGLAPGRLPQDAVRAHEWGAQPVGVGVQTPEGRALGADEALAQDVVTVAAGAGDRRSLDGEGESAGGFAERADTQSGAGIVGHGPSPGRRQRWRTGMRRRAADRTGGASSRPDRAYRPVRMLARCWHHLSFEDPREIGLDQHAGLPYQSRVTRRVGVEGELEHRVGGLDADQHRPEQIGVGVAAEMTGEQGGQSARDPAVGLVERVAAWPRADRSRRGRSRGPSASSPGTRRVRHRSRSASPRWGCPRGGPRCARRRGPDCARRVRRPAPACWRRTGRRIRWAHRHGRPPPWWRAVRSRSRPGARRRRRGSGRGVRHCAAARGRAGGSCSHGARLHDAVGPAGGGPTVRGPGGPVRRSRPARSTRVRTCSRRVSAPAVTDTAQRCPYAVDGRRFDSYGCP